MLKKLISLFALILLALLAGCGELAGNEGEPDFLAAPVLPEGPPQEIEGVGILAQGGDFTPPGHTVQVDLSSNDLPANGSSVHADLNWDGSVLSFSSRATNLAPSSSGANYQVYRKDLKTGEITKKSVNGAEGNGTSYRACLSPSGDTVTFYSRATNLAPPPTGGYQAFTCGMDNELERLSPGSGHLPRMAGEHKVVYASNNSTLVSPDTNSTYDVFLKDLRDGSLELVSRNAAGEQANGQSDYCDSSGDGRFVVFRCRATNMGEPGNLLRVFLRDLVTGETTLVSGDLHSMRPPQISADGNLVSFCNSSRELWVYDRRTGELTLEMDEIDREYSLSRDGRFLTAARFDDPSFPGDRSSLREVYVKDLVSGEMALVSSDLSLSCLRASISGNGSTIVWEAGGHIYLKGNPLYQAPPALPATPAQSWPIPVEPVVVSRNSAGQPGDGPSHAPRLSFDGSKIAFLSRAGNMVADPSGFTALNPQQAYRKDLQSGQVDLVSRDYHFWDLPDRSATDLRISSDGQKVAFLSSSTNLLASPLSAALRAYVHDLGQGETEIVSADGPYPVEATTLESFSGDNWVAYGADEHYQGQYLRDLTTQQTEVLASPYGQDKRYADLTADGRYYVYLSEQTPPRLYLQNREEPYTYPPVISTGTVQHPGRVQISEDGAQFVFVDDLAVQGQYQLWMRENEFYNPQLEMVATTCDPVAFDINHDAEYLVYLKDDQSSPGDGYRDVWITRTSTGESLPVSDLQVGYAHCASPSISGNGRAITWSEGDHVYLVQNPFYSPLQTSARTVSTDQNGVPANSSCYYPSLNHDGTYVAFSTSATNLGSSSSYGYKKYRKNTLTGRLDRLDHDPETNWTSSDYSTMTALSDDGLRAFFAGDFYGLGSGVFTRDFRANDLERISVATIGASELAAVAQEHLFYIKGNDIRYLNMETNLQRTVSTFQGGLFSGSNSGQLCYLGTSYRYYLWHPQASPIDLNISLGYYPYWLDAAVSPSGEYVGVSRSQPGGNPYRVDAVNLASGESLQLGSAQIHPNEPPRFSADDKYRAYILGGDVYVQEMLEIPVVSAQRITYSGQCSMVTISGDGGVIAWVEGGQVRVVKNPFL